MLNRTYHIQLAALLISCQINLAGTVMSILAYEITEIKYICGVIFSLYIKK